MIPAAEISEQISLAGTEASGTSNMKFMINSALTLGTLDGANVEIHDAVGSENMFLFGLTTPEVNSLKRGYNPRVYVDNNPVIRRAIEEVNHGIGGVNFNEIYRSLTSSDPYMVMADFESYSTAQKKAQNLYRSDPTAWTRMGLINTAHAGIFAADRAIREYADNIWFASPIPDDTDED